jgi:D-alanyl-D-alanine carboxypeptidase
MNRSLQLLVFAALLTACGVTSAVPSGDLATTAQRSAAPAASTEVHAVGPELVAAGHRPSRPAQPAFAARYQADLVADHCVDRDLPTPEVADPAFTILDRSYALAAGSAPDDLVVASAAGLTEGSATKRVRAVIVDDLAAMREAWEAAGLTVTIESAYRSYDSQALTFNSWVARIGRAGALLRTARPGHSEHQLGTAIDFTSPGWTGRFGDWATESAEGAWMAAHAWEYGFVMSYPAGSEAQTCFTYEPWHYRWIGRDAAAAQHASGMHLRQFLVVYVAS